MIIQPTDIDSNATIQRTIHLLVSSALLIDRQMQDDPDLEKLDTIGITLKSCAGQWNNEHKLVNNLLDWSKTHTPDSDYTAID